MSVDSATERRWRDADEAMSLTKFRPTAFEPLRCANCGRGQETHPYNLCPPRVKETVAPDCLGPDWRLSEQVCNGCGAFVALHADDGTCPGVVLGNYKRAGTHPPTREFGTGAFRDAETGKLDYEGFLSPVVLERYAQYMHKHRELADGTLRDSDNWQKGIPRGVYMKSLVRHTMDFWKAWRNKTDDQELACAIMFNIMGWLHETLTHNQQKG